MNGFVKLRRGLAEHVGSRRMTLTEHGAYTLLLQLADHTTGRWHGTQRSFAAAAGISSGMAWKILTSLERKGYVSWNRERQSVQIQRFFVEKPAQNPVEKPVETERPSPTPDHLVDRTGHRHDHPIRNTRTLLEKRELAPSPQKHDTAPSLRFVEDPKPNPEVMAAILAAMRHVAFADCSDDAKGRARVPRIAPASIGSRRAGDRSPP